VGTCALAHQPGLDKKVTVALSLLKHLAYHSTAARQALLKEGLLDAMRKLWRHGLLPATSTGGGSGLGASAASQAGSVAGGPAVGRPGSTYFYTASPALHELLGLLINMLPDCPEARTRLASEGSPTLLQSVLSLMFEVGTCAQICGYDNRFMRHSAAQAACGQVAALAVVNSYAKSATFGLHVQAKLWQTHTLLSSCLLYVVLLACAAQA
jgi:hypothetical protein